MRKSGIGCNIAGQYCGIFIYADDIILLSASRIGLQAMVDICGTFAKSHNLTFSTNICAKKSKTKCILFAKRVPNMENIAPILLNGTPLPWVDQITHLGHILQNDNSMNIDCNIKRGQFIGKVHSLLQEFYFSSPTVLMKLVNIYCRLPLFMEATATIYSPTIVIAFIVHGMLGLGEYLKWTVLVIGTL